MMLRPRPTELEESLNSWPFVRRGNPLDCLLVVWHQNQSGIFPLSFRALYAVAFFVPVLDSSDHFLHPETQCRQSYCCLGRRITPWAPAVHHDEFVLRKILCRFRSYRPVGDIHCSRNVPFIKIFLASSIQKNKNA